MSEVAARRQFDRRLFLITAVAFPVAILIGFGPSYYARGLVAAPLPSRLVHVHGLLMTLWVGLFVTQVALISVRRVWLHQRLDYSAIGLVASLALIVSYVARLMLMSTGPWMTFAEWATSFV